MYNAEMPLIDLEVLKTTLTEEEYKIAAMVVATKGKNKGRLRASKPFLPKKVKFPGGNSRLYDYHYDYASEEDKLQGVAAYVWRHVAFIVSPIAQHQCMPVMAFVDLPAYSSTEERKAAENGYIALADKIAYIVPRKDHHGTKRWGKALGAI